MAAIFTVGELRALISDLPDDMPVQAYSASVDSYVDFDCSVQEEAGASVVREVFEIYTEN